MNHTEMSWVCGYDPGRRDCVYNETKRNKTKWWTKQNYGTNKIEEITTAKLKIRK